MRICFSLLIIFFYANTFAQNRPRKTHFPVWTFQQKNVNINGISAGLFALHDSTQNVHSNGIRLEAIGLGLFIAGMGKSPIAETEVEFQNRMLDSIAEKINGLNLSATGTMCECTVNGFSAGIVAQFGRQINGVALSTINLFQLHNGLQLGLINSTYSMNGAQVAGAINFTIKAKGLQICFLNNSAEKITGLQVGLFNKTKQLKGLQIGLWNVNQKRKLPLINWNFN